jgi:hypothetical protein
MAVGVVVVVKHAVNCICPLVRLQMTQICSLLFTNCVIFSRDKDHSHEGPVQDFSALVVQFRRISALKVERFLFIFLLLQRSMRICLVAILNGWRILANDGAGGRERKIASIEDRSEKEEAAAVVVVAGTKSKNK